VVEETPEQVTLDDLIPLDYIDPFPLDDDYEPVKAERFTSCMRCGGLVGNEPEHRYEHRRWHAAIEDLTVTISAESTSNFFDNSPPSFRVKGSHALRTSVTPEQRRELVVALGLDPNRADDCTWPAIMDRVRDQLTELVELAERRAVADATVVHKPFADPTSGIEQCRNKLAAALAGNTDGVPFDDLCEVVEFLQKDADRCKTEHAGLYPREVARLRRIEQALIDVGAPNRSERGDPGGLVVAWIREQVTAMRHLRKELDYVNKYVRPERDRLLAELKTTHQILSGAEDASDSSYTVGDVQTLVERLPIPLHNAGGTDGPAEQRVTSVINAVPKSVREMHQDLVEALGLDQNTGFYDALDEVRALIAKWSAHTCEAQCSLDHYEEGVEGPWRQAQMDKAAAEVEQPAEAEVCPSLYLHNDTLVSCKATWEHDRHQDTPTGSGDVVWFDNQAVPSPWPLDQEPPAGINLLRDTGSNTGVERDTPMPYLLRFSDQRWRWSETPDGTGRTTLTGSWAEATVAVQNGLVVVRP
jgi:hypothetical protein